MSWVAHWKHLQVMFKEFDSTAAPNKEVLIQIF